MIGAAAEDVTVNVVYQQLIRHRHAVNRGLVRDNDEEKLVSYNLKSISVFGFFVAAVTTR